MGLAPERGITTGLPSLHARSMAACELKPGESVIQVGAGSGYFSAILAELVGESGSVVAFEIDNSLAKAAERNLKRWKQVRIEATSGVSGISGSADVVCVTSLQPNGYCPGNDRFRDVFRVFAKNRGRKNCVISSCARWLRPTSAPVETSRTGHGLETRTRRAGFSSLTWPDSCKGQGLRLTPWPAERSNRYENA
jgi:SAM-dependent methyltransferase